MLVASNAAVSRRVRRAGAWVAVALLCAASPVGGDGFVGAGSSSSVEWVDHVALSPAERREFDERRAALKARADDWADQVVTCPDIRSRVRDDLARVQHVRAVEVSFVLLTSHPPQMPVTFAIALDTGRVVWDRLMVIVPMHPGLVLLGGPAEGLATSRCPPVPR